MQLLLFKTLWGHEGDIGSAAMQVQAAGFDGIEGPVPRDAASANALTRLLAATGLQWIGEICTGGGYVPRRDAAPQQQLDELRDALAAAAPLQPRHCNLIAGCDFWPLATQIEFFQRALELIERSGVRCSFENHRSRSLFNPWITVELLQRVPALRLTCDLSHWAVVCERLPDSEWECVLQVAEHADHIHGRVGYDQGPQVPHPAAPEYADALHSHQRCWEAIWRAQRRRGFTATTMTPEFGPDGYLHCLPFTAAPVADLWQINQWMGATERDHFARCFTANDVASEPSDV